MRWVSLAAVLVSAASLAGCATFDPKHPMVGKPSDFDASPAIYAWLDDGVWHVRLVGKGGHRFQGSVAGVRGGVLDLKLSQPDLKDRVALAGDAVQFDVETSARDPAPPGFEVRVAGGCARFDLYVDGRRHSDRVRLGPRLHRPTHIPFERCP